MRGRGESGKRGRGKQKSLEDGMTMKKQTGVEFASINRASENRTRWKGIFVKSSLLLLCSHSHNDISPNLSATYPLLRYWMSCVRPFLARLDGVQEELLY